ncbi:MAG TPA: DUF2799 domain-containing protein [Burkholderiales bacterium]|nr:DUF2799 domain-containing protein [Burkholderiales bacterium]
MRSAPLLILVLLSGGCAGLEAEDCRRADWYALGFRDAMYGLQRHDDTYAWQCAPYDLKVDAPRYAQGWQEGKYEFERRTAQSQD